MLHRRIIALKDHGAEERGTGVQNFNRKRRVIWLGAVTRVFFCFWGVLIFRQAGGGWGVPAERN